jgi:hypothetical protein
MATRSRFAAPLGVIMLGIVSFLTDLSSETIFAVLPIYFIAVISGSSLTLGIMEGLADFASSSLDLASGYLSDRTGRRKWIATMTPSANTKPCKGVSRPRPQLNAKKTSPIPMARTVISRVMRVICCCKGLGWLG